MVRKSTDEVQLKLRFGEKLRRQLARAADQSGRSMNSEIIHRLEQSFAQAAMWKRAQSFERKLDKINDIPELPSSATTPEIAAALRAFLAIWRIEKEEDDQS
jgi:DNA polymerase/3'-5' exonuclease PolX